MFVFVSRRFRGLGAPLSAPRAGATGMATGMATGLSVFQICKRNTPVSQSENQHQKGLHRPGIEPGSVPWQGTILPLDHRCFCCLLVTQYVSEKLMCLFSDFWNYKPSVPRKMSTFFTPVSQPKCSRRGLTPRHGAAAVTTLYSKPETQHPPVF